MELYGTSWNSMELKLDEAQRNSTKLDTIRTRWNSVVGREVVETDLSFSKLKDQNPHLCKRPARCANIHGNPDPDPNLVLDPDPNGATSLLQFVLQGTSFRPIKLQIQTDPLLYYGLYYKDQRFDEFGSRSQWSRFLSMAPYGAKF